MGKRVPLGTCIFLAPLSDVARHQGELVTTASVH